MGKNVNPFHHPVFKLTSPKLHPFHMSKKPSLWLLWHSNHSPTLKPNALNCEREVSSAHMGTHLGIKNANGSHHTLKCEPPGAVTFHFWYKYSHARTFSRTQGENTTH